MGSVVTRLLDGAIRLSGQRVTRDNSRLNGGTCYFDWTAPFPHFLRPVAGLVSALDQCLK